MRDFSVKNGDWVLGAYTTDLQTAVQALELELSTRLNEWFLDEDYGLDMTVFQDKFDEEEIIAEINRVVANEERLTVSNDIEVTFNTLDRIVTVYVPLIDNNGDEVAIEVNSNVE